MSSTAAVALTLILLSLTFSPSLEDPSGTKCTSVNGVSCSCETDEGPIDLSALSSSDGPRFTGMQDVNGFTYSFNPCKTFTEPYECTSGVYVCQESQQGDYNYAIADGQESMYIDNDGTPYIYYTGPGLRETMVHLICDKSVGGDGEITTTGDSKTYLVYEFILTSAHACPGGVGGAGGNIAGVAGIVIMILIILGVVTYFVVGAIIMKVHYQKNGSDLLIHKLFWFALPGLIKEGVLFTFSPCVNAVRGRRQGYKEEL